MTDQNDTGKKDQETIPNIPDPIQTEEGNETKPSRGPDPDPNPIPYKRSASDDKTIEK